MFKAIDKWLLPYLFRRRPKRGTGKLHLLVAVCDHYEPFHHTDKEGALRRVRHWAQGFPKLTESFRDADECPPRHTFFYPIEQYDEDVVGEIAAMCHATGSEAEIHLHHDNDSRDGLRVALESGKENLARHGLLARDGDGRIVFGFIHGDWALDDSHPTGRHCGVPDELGILREAGCYGDFTMPSAPSPTQTRTVNAVYYAKCGPEPKSHDRGTPVSGATRTLRDTSDHILLIQGPLGLNWQWRKYGVLPRVENGDLTGLNPPTASRLQLWKSIGARIGERPDVVFVKLHTHGAVERNSEMLLCEPMRAFHRLLAECADVETHYVTAREMANILHALEDGKPGNPGAFRDYLYPRNC